jgi:hypothetical protein
MVKKDTTQAANTTADASKFRYIYVRKSVERRVHRRKLATVFLVFILISMLLAGTVYAVLAFVDNNDFRITIERGRGVLALSENANLSNKTTQLTTRGPSEMMDMTYSSLPFLQFRTQDGSYNQADFYASSFYLTNLGDKPCEYRELITITDAYNQLEDCVRVLVIRELLQPDGNGGYVQASLNEDYQNMQWTCYAKAKEDGTPEQVAYDIGRDGGKLNTVTDPNYGVKDKKSPWMCTNFVKSNTGVVTDPDYHTLEPDARMRYTIVIWIEGTDPDTIDDRIGGKITMRFGFSTTSDEEQTVD